MSERIELFAGINFNSDATTQKNLEKALEDLQKKISGKMDLKVDLNFDDKNIAKLSQQLEDVSSKLMAVNNIGFSKVQSNFESLQDTMDGFKTSSISQTIVDDKVIKQVTTLKNELNQVQKITQTPGKSATYVNTDNIEKQEKAIEKFEIKISNLRSKLELIGNTGNFDNDYIQILKSELSSLDISSSEREIKSLATEIKDLGKSSSQITTLTKNIDSLNLKLNTLRNDKSINVDTTVAKNNIKKVESEIYKLENMRDKLSNGKFFDGSQINSQVDKANIAFTELKGSVEKVNEEFVGLNNSIKIIDGMKTSNVSETIVGDSTVKRVTTLKNELNQVQKIIETPGKTITYVNTDNIEKQEKAILKMESRIESAKEKLNLLSQTGNFDSSFIDDLQNKLNSINTDSAESEIKSIENELKNLSNSSNQITTLNKTIDNLTIKYKTLQDNKSIKMDTDKAVASAKNLESEINRLKVMRDELSNGKFFDGSQVQAQVNKASSAFTELKGNVERVNNTSKTFASTLQNVGVYISAFTAFNTVKNVLKDSAEYILELDNAMVELNKVLKDGESISSSFMSNVQAMSKELGSSGDQIIQAVALWERAGENLQDSQELANTTIMAKFVGDETDVETAQKHLIAPMTAFKKSAEETIQIVDELNNVSNNMATDYATMGEALSRSASSMATAGNTMEQTIALIGTAESKTKLGGETNLSVRRVTCVGHIFNCRYKLRALHHNNPEKRL